MVARYGLGPLLFHAVAACWTEGITPELCCDQRLGPRGNPDCWDAEYTYERCCEPKSSSAQPSADVAGFRIEPTSVPRLPLKGTPAEFGMPITGVGLCCRPSAMGDAVRQAVVDYLLMGGRHLDDAMLYRNHREVGEGVRQAVALGVPRKEIFLTTKIWSGDFGWELTTAWVGRMLEELGLEYVDLVLLHVAGVPSDAECKDPLACRQETWLALQRARNLGLIKNLGVSNFGPRQMRELMDLRGAPITVNQLEYHPWAPNVHHETAAWCHQHGIAVTAYGSMGSANMADQMLDQDALKQIGDRYQKTAAQVLLRWAVQKNVSVIPGTSTPKHMAQNLRLFDFKLSDGEMSMLDNVPEEARMLHFGHTPDASP